MCELLQKCRCLRDVLLSDCHLETKSIVQILEAALHNTSNLPLSSGGQKNAAFSASADAESGFTFDFSKNDMGSKGAKELQQAVNEMIKRAAGDASALCQIGTLRSCYGCGGYEITKL